MKADRHDSERRESLRWIILRTTLVGGHLGVTEDMVLPVARSSWLGTAREDLRNEIDYLERRRLITTERPPLKPWRIRLTRHGTDVVEYTVDCDPGISRPEKYWAD